MNRRTLFQALIGSAAVATDLGAKSVAVQPDEPKESDEFLPVLVGWHTQETTPQGRSRCFRILAPKCEYYHRDEIAASPWLRWMRQQWIDKTPGWIH